MLFAGKQEGMVWERPRIKYLKPKCMKLGERLQNMETPIKGMELALTSCPSFPVSMDNPGLRDTLLAMEAQIGLKLELAKCSLPFEYSTTAPETKGELVDNSIQILTANSTGHKELTFFFFLFCVKLLHDDSLISPNPESRLQNSQKAQTEEASDSTKQNKCDGCLRMIGNSWKTVLKSERLLFAFKCSLSLGLAVLFGLIYNKENGYWSGLTIAISFVTGRQATFTVANARAQGTVMGSVYGILGCFIIQRYAETRFILLFPWIIFTTFLKHSRMYGQSGGISAVIGALLILGRKDYGSPSVFAIARITEAFIGLSCFIMVEFLLQPARAATLAKDQLSQSLQTLGECIKEITLNVWEEDSPGSTSLALRKKQKNLKFHLEELERFIGEAQLEPNLWFKTFRESCYSELLKLLLKMVDILLFVAYEIEFLSQVSNSSGVAWKELQEHINDDLQHFKERVGSALKCLEEVTLIESLAALEKELQKKKNSHDIEFGKAPEVDAVKLLSTDGEEVEIILSSFLQHLKEANEKIQASEGEQKQKSQMILCLSSLGFCISSLMKGTIEIEKQVKELVKWENPLSHIDLREISCKINTLCIYRSSRPAS